MNCRRFAIAFLTLGLLGAACTGSSENAGDGVDSTVADDGDAPGTDDGAGTSDQADDSTDAGSDGSADGGSDDPSDPTPATTPPLTPGPCGIDQLAHQSLYAVSEIPDDDPDGGLNVRAYDGRRIATLPEGTVVYVMECEIRDNSNVWWDIGTEAKIDGWVNSAFLDENIPPWAPTTGGNELAGVVRTLLDSLAAEDWIAATAVLAESSIETQLAPDAGTDLAGRVAAYCERVICDAPYEVVAVRGAHIPRWIGPQVDVRIFYPQGEVIETFRGFIGDDSSYVSTLPGRSALAFNPVMPSVADMAEGGSTELADAGLYEAAEEIRAALVSESGPRIPDRYIPAEGIAVSPEAYVDPDATDRVVITAADLADGGQLRIWGYTDGQGAPILDTVQGWMATYRRNLALIDPDDLGVDERVAGSNTVDNVLDVFPGAHIVEFHRQGRGEGAFSNWSSVLLVIGERDGQWKLLAITSDTWTI